MLKLSERAKILSAESKTFKSKDDGSDITYHRVRANIEGEVYEFRSDEKQVKEFKDYIGMEGDIVLYVSVRKEVSELKVESFQVDS